MTIDKDNLLESILESIGRIDYVRPEKIPDIDLYMDQVTTFMEEQFRGTRRYPEDKVLTKTMINNYAKNNLLPPPVKKKYSKEHMLVLIFIFYFKSLLSIRDIETLFRPLTDKYFDTDGDITLTGIYEEVCRLEKGRIGDVQESIRAMYEQAEQTWKDAPEEEQEYLRLFSFICSLSFDVYVKKQLIEKLIDTLPEPEKKK